MNKFLLAGSLIAALGAGAPGIASAQAYTGSAYHGVRSTAGVIASVNGTNITLRSGQQIFLKSGTVINPRGWRLQPGQRISVSGSRGGNGAINAEVVNVRGHRRY